VEDPSLEVNEKCSYCIPLVVGRWVGPLKLAVVWRECGRERREREVEIPG